MSSRRPERSSTTRGSTSVADSLTSVAVYRRTIRASLSRVWENVLDWEHLPWLHRSSFSDIKLLESGPWGWCARVGLQPAGEAIDIELRIERDLGRYVTRTTAGLGEGSEIWTRLKPLSAQRTGIEVEFLLPNVGSEQAEGLAATHTRLYTQLWDEDEAMMMRREQLLSRRPPARIGGDAPLVLGALEDVRAQLPLVVALDGRPFRVVELDGALVAHSTVCPHSLGPLEDAPLEQGCIRCPWHGYRYDVRSGRSVDGRGRWLGPAPRVEIDSKSQQVRLVWDASA